MRNANPYRGALAAFLVAGLMAAAHSEAAELRTARANTGMVEVVDVGEGSDLVELLEVTPPAGATAIRGFQMGGETSGAGRVAIAILVAGDEVWEQQFYRNSMGEPVVLAGGDRYTLTGAVQVRVRFFNETGGPALMRGTARVAFIVAAPPGSRREEAEE